MKTFSKSPGSETLRSIPCPNCAGQRFRDHWDCGDFSFVRCAACGLIHQNPQPHQEELTTRYDEEYFAYEQQNEAQFHALMQKGLDDIRFSRITGELGAGSSFLDIGCATGMLISELAKTGWETHGVEVCEPAVRFARNERGCDIFLGTLENARFPENRFDVVHSSHVIEHLTDPVGFVREIRRVLKPGGYIITTTPNAGGLQPLIFGENWRSAIADHMALFSRRTLKNLLCNNGFSVIRSKTWGGLGVGTAPRWLKYVADKCAKPLGFGDVMIVLAKKGISDAGFIP